jgi:peroxiredoxin
VNPAELFAGKNVIMFALPGAFTPTCSAKHVPGYVRELPQLKAKGVDMVACLSVNDAWVMKFWAEQSDAMGKIVMLADGNGDFSKALGIEQDLGKAQMGLRARRGVLHIENGVVNEDQLRRQMITRAELEAAARKQGFRSLEAVDSAVLEPGGGIAFAAREPKPEDARHDEVLRRFDQVIAEIEALRRATRLSPGNGRA